MIRFFRITGLLIWAALVPSGCSRPNDLPQSAQPSSPPVVQVARSTKDALAQVSRPRGVEKKGKDSVPDAAGKVANAVPFQAPYLERQDPFRRPDFNKTTTAKRDDRLGTGDIVLKGFANAGSMRVLLAIDGQIAAVKEGEQRADTQVITIAPPQVILQRGRVRWTESLYERQ